MAAYVGVQMLKVDIIHSACTTVASVVPLVHH